MWAIFLLSALVALSARAADVCGEADLRGPYALQLSGVSTISSSPTPSVSLARIVFDSEGNLSGYSSVNFNGLLLGNPVTGSYQAGSDCKISWSMQDDSGAFQYFTGKMTPGGNKAEVQQTDRGAGVRGVLERTSEACAAESFRGRYAFALSGTSTTLVTGGAPKAVSIDGVAEADGGRNFTLTLRRDGKPLSAAGTFEVDADCLIHIQYSGTEGAVKLRGILVNGGKEILAIRIDPGETAAARFTAR